MERPLPSGRNSLSSFRWTSAVAFGMTTLLAAGVASAAAQDWETVFTFSGPGEHVPSVIMQDPFGPPESATSRLIVGMESSIYDLVWVNLLDGTWRGQTVSGSNTSDLTYDPSSAGLLLASRSPWAVLRSLDRGISWTPIDAADGGPTDLTFDDRGNIYVCGTEYSAAIRAYVWHVRRSSDHGKTWSTADRLSKASADGGLLLMPGTRGGVFVAGWREGGAAGTIWTVRRSRDQGATWQQVDSFSHPSRSTGASAMATDARGRIFVVGGSGLDPVSWEVRVSEDGGDTWATISPPQAFSYGEGVSNPRAAVVDGSGRLWIAGSLGGCWAVTHRTADGVWQDIDFPFGQDCGFPPPEAYAIGLDVLGNILVAGREWLDPNDPVAMDRLVIQRRMATELPPLTIKQAGRSLLVAWPAALSGVQLEAADSLGASPTWTSVPTLPEIFGDQNVVTLEVGAAARFFRLRKP